MLDKSYLSNSINDIFPDLDNTKFKLNNSLIISFTEHSLLPFLIYQNTVEEFNRCIGLFLPRNSSMPNLIPFYIMIGQYRKALNNIIHAKGLDSRTYIPNEKLLNYNGSICSISTVDFINRQIVFQSGRGVTTSLSFFQSYNINWQKSSLDIKQKIESLELIDKGKEGNIFSYPISHKENKIEGIIIFTNTTKFESLLRNVKVSGTDLREYINIQKVDFSSKDGSIKFKSLSKSSTHKKPISLLVARHDSFRAFESIIAAGGEEMKNIKTIIIDNFDELIDRWERNESIESELQELNTTYFERIKIGKIKNVYLISQNNSLYIHEILNRFGVNYYPWLLKPLEETIINSKEQLEIEPKIIISTLQNETFDLINQKINQLISEWKSLALTSFCSGEILIPITFLLELRLKHNSFFDPFILSKAIEDFILKLKYLKSKWFNEGQDYNKIEETVNFISDNFKSLSLNNNYKLNSVFNKLKEFETISSVLIVSDNKNSDDIKWLLELLRKSYPDYEISHCYKKEFLISKQEIKYQGRLIIYLTSNKKLLGDAIGNLFAEKQIFVLNKAAFSFTVSFIKRLQNIQTDVSSDDRKYQLLNLKNPLNSQTPILTDNISILYESQPTINPYVDKVFETQETEIQNIVEEIIQKELIDSQKSTLNQHILFFDDGTILEVPETRHFFVYEEDKDSDDIDKSQKTAKNLEVGTQIITTKRGLDVKDLLQQELKKNDHFSYLVEMDEKWRLLINLFMTRNNMDLEYFCTKLAKNNFRIGPSALKHWIDADTRRPDNFKNLLESLALLGVINIGEINDYDNCNSELKSIQIKFVRTATRRLIDKFNGINFEEDDLFTDDLLNDFVNHIEIKRVTANYKI